MKKLLTKFVDAVIDTPMVVGAIVIISTLLYAIGASESLAIQPRGEREWWQVLSHIFAHGNPIHLFLNILALWVFGSIVEKKFGSYKFMLFFMCAAIGASAASLITKSAFMGASGGIFGVLVAFAYIHPSSLVHLFFAFPIQAKRLIWVLVISEVLRFLFTHDVGSIAHLFGMFSGYLILKYWDVDYASGRQTKIFK